MSMSSTGFANWYVGLPSERTTTWSPSSAFSQRTVPRTASSITVSPSAGTIRRIADGPVGLSVRVRQRPE